MMSTAIKMFRSTGRQRRRGLRRWVLVLALMLLLPSVLAWRDAPSLDQALVLTNADLSLASTMPTRAYVCTIGGAIDAGLARYVARVVREASAVGAAVILRIDSTGGLVDAALQIRDTILRASVPTVAFVEGRAWSAAALIAMAAEHLAMAPGSSIGAAEPIPLTIKTLSAVRAEFEATAEARGRDSLLAAAMVDASIVIPGLVDAGQLLSMTAGVALERGFADAGSSTMGEAADSAGMAGVTIVDAPQTSAEKLARLLTHPAVAPVLLTVALVSLVIEVFSAGFGAAGIVGLVALGLFFGGHLIAGVGGWEVTALFILGVALLLIEGFVPGFGIFGVGGLVAMIASVYLASRSSTDARRSLVVDIVASTALSLLMISVGMRRGWFARLTLAQSLRTDQGFIAREQRVDLMGRTGTAVTSLRPAGTARFGELLLDVVSEGMFIGAGTAVTVIRVEGPRVVVSPAQPGLGQ